MYLTVSQSMPSDSNSIKADKMQPLSANGTFELKGKANHLICHHVLKKKKKSATCNYPICGVQSVSSFAFMMNENISAGFCKNCSNLNKFNLLFSLIQFVPG